HCNCPESFDLFVFALNWIPGFCASSRQPTLKPFEKFTIHGLWPSFEDSTRDPPRQQITQLNLNEISPIVHELEQKWPSVVISKGNKWFWNYEWTKHGTAAASVAETRGQLNYFKKAIELYDSLAVILWLDSAGIIPSNITFYDLSKVIDAVEGNFGYKTRFRCYYTSMDTSYLIEIKFCFTKNFQRPHYVEDADGSNPAHSLAARVGGKDPQKNAIEKFLHNFNDGQIFALIGIGLGFNHIRNYCFNSFGLSILIFSLCTQFALLLHNVFMQNNHIFIGIEEIMWAQKISIAVIVSIGSFHGKCNPLQIIIASLIEVPILMANKYIGFKIMKVADIGGGIHLYLFAAHFGLGISTMFWKYNDSRKRKLTSDNCSELGMLISIVLMYGLWPGLNAAFSRGDKKHRIVVNTYLSICSACVMAFAVSSLSDRKNRFTIKHLHIAVIGGAVSVSSVADMMITPYFALLIGLVSALSSLLFFIFVKSAIGIPGILAGFASAIFAYISSEKQYGYSLFQIFVARAPTANSSDLHEILSYLPDISAGEGRTNYQQFICQIAYVGVTLLIAILGGCLTGLIIRQPFFEPLKSEDLFEDNVNWVLPSEEEEYFGNESYCDIESSMDTEMNLQSLKLPQQRNGKRKNENYRDSN
ncbi:Rh-related protein-like protein, partial [Dinothrombium tinctorium]